MGVLGGAPLKSKQQVFACCLTGTCRSSSLLAAHQHQGYGFEFLVAVLKHVLDERPGLKFVYRVNPNNRASIALVEKIGGILQPAKSAIEEYFMKTYIIDPEYLHWDKSVCEPMAT